MTVTRICWDCQGSPVREWHVISESRGREGHVMRITCPGCRKESRVYGWMIGCECELCKSQVIGAGK
jgi:ribosomal protein S27E